MFWLHISHIDHTSLRSSYLTFATTAPTCSSFSFTFPQCPELSDTYTLSITKVRGEFSSSSSSSLVYHFLCIIDVFLNILETSPPTSEIFSATLFDDGGMYLTGELITSDPKCSDQIKTNKNGINSANKSTEYTEGLESC